MLIDQIIQRKGGAIYSVTPDQSLASVAALLHARKVGAFIVTDVTGRVAGIVSERDIIRAIAQVGAEALDKPVSNFMTKDVISAQLGQSINTLLECMTDRRIRHLPVMEGARLVGIVSIGDLVKSKIAQAEHEAETLKNYILGG